MVLTSHHPNPHKGEFMKHALFIIALMSIAPLAHAAPDQYTRVTCIQSCGLTPNAQNSVRFMSLDQSTSLSAIYDLCRNQQFSLQGQPKCTETKFDFSNNERYQRCKRGISPLGSCFVSVDGYGPSDRYSHTFQASSTNTLDEAEASALAKCHAAVGPYGSCHTNWYYAY